MTEQTTVGDMLANIFYFFVGFFLILGLIAIVENHTLRQEQKELKEYKNTVPMQSCEVPTPTTVRQCFEEF